MRLFGLVLWLLVEASYAKESDIALMAAKLANLRGEVEGLQNQLELKRSEVKQNMQSLGLQAAELEAGIERNKTSLHQFQKKIASLLKEDQTSIDLELTLKTRFEAALSRLKQLVQASIPFQKQERLALIDEVLEEMALPEKKATEWLPKAWRLIEDENRLGQDFGVYKEVILLDGEEQMVDLIRLGRFMVLFKDQKSRYGYGSPMAEQFQILVDAPSKKAIDELFLQVKNHQAKGKVLIPKLAFDSKEMSH